MVIQAARSEPLTTVAHTVLARLPLTTCAACPLSAPPLEAAVGLPSAALATSGYTSTTHRLTRDCAEIDT